ncbi:hypothetical protein [Uliginosibacterium sp. H1]|uniref:hypothetical protein n=1 Tax=Uliginosibacterium sp. H1 TaxID=3114757 RepID=UPI002E197546|nr:hypothetical protein [Uliginosibacterium sp. H1]
MELGHLKIPKPALEQFSYIPDIETRLFVQYHEIISSTAQGKAILSALEADPRVADLEGQMILKGSSARRFDPTTLAMWFLWAANEIGQDAAERGLEAFLNTEEITIINTLWVLGLEPKNPIKLTHGLRITPVEDMPDSREKEQYLMHPMNFSLHQSPRPKAAITHLATISRSRSDWNVVWDDELVASSKLINDLALVLNAVEDISCTPHFHTSYNLPGTPLGPFGASGGGVPIYDVAGHATSALTESSVDEINTLLCAFLTLQETEKSRLGRALSRLCQSKRRHQIEDKILDLGIALEMALLDDNKSSQQLAQSLRLRGSWLIAETPDERVSIHDDVNLMYSYRSQVAHSGILCGGRRDKIQAVQQSFPKYCRIAERALKKLICNGRPDWTRLLLGAI